MYDLIGRIFSKSRGGSKSECHSDLHHPKSYHLNILGIKSRGGNKSECHSDLHHPKSLRRYIDYGKYNTDPCPRPVDDLVTLQF